MCYKTKSVCDIKRHITCHRWISNISHIQTLKDYFSGFSNKIVYTSETFLGMKYDNPVRLSDNPKFYDSYSS
jgi:hypothetical protein